MLARGLNTIIQKPSSALTIYFNIFVFVQSVEIEIIKSKMKHIAVLGLATLVKGDCETLEGTQLPGARKFLISVLISCGFNRFRLETDIALNFIK